MFDTLIVIPAYGRTYNDVSEVIADWNGNKDFKMVGGPYINKDDARLIHDSITVKARELTVMVQAPRK